MTQSEVIFIFSKRRIKTKVPIKHQQPMNFGVKSYQMYEGLDCDYCRDGKERIVYGLGSSAGQTGDSVVVCKSCLITKNFGIFLKHAKRNHFDGDEEFKEFNDALKEYKKAKRALDKEQRKLVIKYT